MRPDVSEVVDELRRVTPSLLRWSGMIARRMRSFDIGLTGKSSGSSNTDALTLADLTLQELIVAGLRDAGKVLRQCRIEAEETTGDLDAFPAESPLTIAIDPIDGTKYFQNRTGEGYAVMLHLRDDAQLYYSLVFAPEAGPTGTWTQAYGDVVKCGPDNTSVSAETCLQSIPPVDRAARPNSNRIYVIGFQKNDPDVARKVTAAGLQGVAPDDMPGSIYPLLARGDFGGSLIHTPNLYDYPVSHQLAQLLGGDSVWVHNGERVNFRETWLDERANMLRLPGIVATADSAAKLKVLCELAKDWSRSRYGG